MAESLLFTPEELGRPQLALPTPELGRFQPLRAGILNLWQYDEQEFRFHQGRLILRGENGSGKSKALELLLPFLLDADLSPHRLDPFAGTARTMRWNLLEGDKHDNRLGYAWLELGRLDGDGRPLYLTIGAGLRATRRTQGVDSWYFVTDLRVGEGLELVNPARLPLPKDQLRQALEGHGTLSTRGEDHRQEVDQQLFRLGTDRFAALRHLLLQLRRPHLSEKLDPRSLSLLLTESLPPIDEDLVKQLSQSFERLDRDQAELRRVEAAVATVGAFRRVYADYCRGVARARAADVRGAESRYHKTATLVREAEEAEERIGQEIASGEKGEAETATELVAQRGRITALERSEAMQAAQALAVREEQAADRERQAERDRHDAEEAEAQAEEQRREHGEARARVAAAERALEEPTLEARAAAGQAGLEAAHATALEGLGDDPEVAAGVARAAIAERREAVGELRELLRERQRTAERFERAEERRRDADAQARAAAERTRAARQEVEAAREALDAALLAWATELRELALDDAELERLRDAATGEDDEREEAGLAAVLSELADPRREALLHDRHQNAAERERAEAERVELEAERERVEASRELGPEPPPTRAAEREGRPGAPLYLLCDFAPHLGAAERAGLEAALEASGLLDAWVSPDGRLLDAGTLDTVLALDPEVESGQEADDEASAGTLAELLVVVPSEEGARVAPDIVTAILGQIAVADDAADDAPYRVGLDGSWRLGLLHGAWSKESAVYLGAEAREASRRRRLAELERQLVEQKRHLAQLEAAGAEIEARLDLLAAELRALPSTAELRQAQARAEAALDDEARRRRELGEAEAAASLARRERDAAERSLQEKARELRLLAEVNDLDGYLARLDAYREAFFELAQAQGRASEARTRLRRAEELLAGAEARADELARRAKESAAQATRALAEVATLRESVGAEVVEIVARHRQAQDRLAELESGLEALRAALQDQREERAHHAAAREIHQRELTERDAERERSVARLRRFGELGLLPLVVAEDALPEEAPAGWSARRTLELARAIEQAASEVDLGQEAVNRRANRMHTRYQEMVQDLGTEFQPSFDHDEDLQVVSVLHNQRGYDIPALLLMLEDEALTRRGLLAEHERELLEKFLLEEVGSHLRERLRDAHDLVEKMNALLEQLKTASGMALRLSWVPDPEVAADVREVVALLRRDAELLAEAERRQLEAFFRERIAAAREGAEAVPWREHLMTALDYRRWHLFRILRRLPGEGDWHQLTRRGHAASSGGEKAVALHLPLFAAAAAHYESAGPTAPRLIMLDEAFAGIDQGMKGRCMGLLVAFDLDFMMTSHDEWGCYEELPGVATYQLYRDPTLGGVATIRFVWNGESLEEEG